MYSLIYLSLPGTYATFPGRYIVLIKNDKSISTEGRCILQKANLTEYMDNHVYKGILSTAAFYQSSSNIL